MSEPYLNPYESPQVDDKRQLLLDPPDTTTITELQARVEKLERELASNWFFGPTWKRFLAVIGYFILAYAVIVMVSIGFMMFISSVRMGVR